MLDTSKWGKFKLSDIFKIKKTKNINYDDLQSGNTPYVTRTTFNNGVEKKVDSMGFILNIGNSIIIGGESAMAFYQEEPFLTGNNITKLTCSELNKFTGIFICSVLNKEKYRYSYGRAWNMTNVKDTIIKLPLKNNHPDWEYMENYIKNIYICLSEKAYKAMLKE